MKSQNQKRNNLYLLAYTLGLFWNHNSAFTKDWEFGPVCDQTFSIQLTSLNMLLLIVYNYRSLIPEITIWWVEKNQEKLEVTLDPWF